MLPDGDTRDASRSCHRAQTSDVTPLLDVTGAVTESDAVAGQYDETDWRGWNLQGSMFGPSLPIDLEGAGWGRASGSRVEESEEGAMEYLSEVYGSSYDGPRQRAYGEALKRFADRLCLSESDAERKFIQTEAGLRLYEEFRRERLIQGE
jgi:hypothetical protein